MELISYGRTLFFVLGSYQQMLTNVRCVAMCASGTPRGAARRAALEQQLAHLQLSHVELLEGPPPNDPEVELFVGDGTDCRPNETRAYVAHLLGVRRALVRFLASGAPLLLLLEDDVALCTDFCGQLDAALTAWLAAPGPHGVLRVGYLPCDERLDGLAPGDDPWRLRAAVTDTPISHSSRVLRTTALKAVGMQGSVFTRSGAFALALTLRGPTARHVRRALLAEPSPWTVFKAPRGWPLVADHLLQMPCLHSVFVLPPLMIEGDTSGSSVGSGSAARRWGWAALHGALNTDDYHGRPDWVSAYHALNQA